MIWTKRIVFPDGSIIMPEQVTCFFKNFISVEYDIGDGYSVIQPLDGCKYEEITGFKDISDTEAFENDIVEFNHDYWTHADKNPDTITAVVTWDARLGAWTLVSIENPAFRVMLYRHIGKGKVIGRYAPSDTQE